MKVMPVIDSTAAWPPMGGCKGSSGLRNFVSKRQANGSATSAPASWQRTWSTHGLSFMPSTSSAAAAASALGPGPGTPSRCIDSGEECCRSQQLCQHSSKANMFGGVLSAGSGCTIFVRPLLLVLPTIVVSVQAMMQIARRVTCARLQLRQRSGSGSRDPQRFPRRNKAVKSHVHVFGLFSQSSNLACCSHEIIGREMSAFRSLCSFCVSTFEHCSKGAHPVRWFY